MKRSRWLFIAPLLAMLGTVWQADVCLACSCAMTTPESAFESADLVFRGAVVAVDAAGDDRYIRILLDVDTLWKGQTASPVELASDPGSSCSVQFHSGAEYLVFAYEEDGQWQTDICAHSGVIERAGDDLAFLASITPLRVQPEEPSDRDGAPTWQRWLIITGVAVLTGVGAGLYVARRRARA